MPDDLSGRKEHYLSPLGLSGTYILRLFARAASAALRSALRFSAFKTSAMVIVFSTTGPERSALSFSRRSMREGPASLNEGPMVLGSQSGERKSLELEGGGVGDQ